MPMATPKQSAEIRDQVKTALTWLEKKSTARDRANMKRFAIDAPKSYGVSMANIQVLAKKLGRSHELAEALWQTGWYEARLLTAFVDEPDKVTPEQMDRWCRDFDNWGVCDTLCFKLFDRTPHAWAKVAKWSKSEDEFVKRAGVVLIACLSTHDKTSGDPSFAKTLPLIERAASDDRNFVMKGVSWALRGVGRRSAALHQAALEVAQRLAASPDASAKWIGKDAIRDLTKHKPRN